MQEKLSLGNGLWPCLTLLWQLGWNRSNIFKIWSAVFFLAEIALLTCSTKIFRKLHISKALRWAPFFYNLKLQTSFNSKLCKNWMLQSFLEQQSFLRKVYKTAVFFLERVIFQLSIELFYEYFIIVGPKLFFDSSKLLFHVNGVRL